MTFDDFRKVLFKEVAKATQLPESIFYLEKQEKKSITATIEMIDMQKKIEQFQLKKEKERKKVISAIENRIVTPKCRDCPWDECEEQHETVELPLGLVKKALEYLKAQKQEV